MVNLEPAPGNTSNSLVIRLSENTDGVQTGTPRSSIVTDRRTCPLVSPTVSRRIFDGPMFEWYRMLPSIVEVMTRAFSPGTTRALWLMDEDRILTCEAASFCMSGLGDERTLATGDETLVSRQ
jgi:hypothetical protein